MNKSVAAYWVFAGSLVLVFFTMLAEAKAQVPDRSLSFRDLAQTLQSPQDIARYVWKNFLYEDDQRQFGVTDRWQSPEELMENRKGDCEDFALFARDVLRLQGQHSFLLNLYDDSYAHTLCVYEEGGKYRAIDGTEVLPYAETSLNDLAKKVHPSWKTGAIVEPSTESPSGRILKEFERNFSAAHRVAISA